jgi:hypothetical protein
VIEIRDEFLSEEDLDIKNMSEEELYAYWNFWLKLAQSSNDSDQYTYSHGVFVGITEPHYYKHSVHPVDKNQ